MRWGELAPERGVPVPQRAGDAIMVAPWPRFDQDRQDKQTESQFALFQSLLGALREIRARQGISPKQPIDFSVCCQPEVTRLLQPMKPYFASMASASAVDWGPQTEPPTTGARVNRDEMEVYVNLEGLIDVQAEVARLEKELEKTLKLIQVKEKKLSNVNFVERAPAEIVQRERESLAQLQQQVESLRRDRDTLRTT